MIQLCIFDCDGTILDTLESIAHSANLALKDMDLPEAETEAFRKMVGDGAAKLMERLLERCNANVEDKFEQLYQKYMDYFQTGCVYHVKPYDGICELLTELKRKQIKLAVLSNKPDQQTKKVIHDYFGDSLFDMVLGQKKEIRRKPAPDGALMIMKEFHMLPEECLYIGDTDTDMQTGNRAGMHTVGVLWGFRDCKELQENHAEYIVKTPMEILNCIEESYGASRL